MNASHGPSQAERFSAIFFRVRSVLRRYWWVPLLTLAVGVGVAAFISSRQETWYQSSARLMVSGRVRIDAGNAYSEEGSNFFGTQIELMRSAQVLEQASARVKSEGRVTPSRISSIDVTTIPNTSIFLLRVTAETSDYSKSFLEAVIEEYIAMKRSMRAEKSETAMSALTEEMLRAEKEWKTAEEDLERFQQRNSLMILREGENAAAKYLASLNERLAGLQTQMRLYERLDLDQLRSLQSQNGKAAGTAPDTEGAAAASVPELLGQGDYLKSRTELQILERKRAQLLENLREGHPEVVALDEQIATQKRVLDNARMASQEEYEIKRRSLGSQIKAIEEEMDSWRAKSLEIGALLGEYGKIKSSVERAKALYERLLASMGNVGLTKSLEPDIISVLERPSNPAAVRPGLQRNLTNGALAGLFLGALILFLLDRSNSQIASPEEFAATFSERVLGLIPSDAKPEAPLQQSDTRHAFAESFYNVRSSLIFLPYDGAMPKIILITSAVPNEGKSTLSTNIALSFAFAGSKTLLIDGDLRRGATHHRFGLTNETGFAEVLQNKVPWRDAVQQCGTPNLSILPRGGIIAQPSKYLVHASTDALLQELYKEYDQVIIDSCPLLAADDTTSLAPKVEAVILVARLGVVSHRQVAMALGSLGSRQANVLGVILNGIDSRGTAYNYYSYSSYYNRDQPTEQGV